MLFAIWKLFYKKIHKMPFILRKISLLFGSYFIRKFINCPSIPRKDLKLEEFAK